MLSYLEDDYFTDVTSIAVLLSGGYLFHRCDMHGLSLIWGTFPWRRSAFPWVVTSGDESVRTCRVGVPREWPHSHPPAGCFLRWPWLILAPHRRFHSPYNKRNQLLHVIQSIHPSYLETSYFLQKSFQVIPEFKILRLKKIKKECLGVPMHTDIIYDQDTKFLLSCINSTI